MSSHVERPQLNPRASISIEASPVRGGILTSSHNRTFFSGVPYNAAPGSGGTFVPKRSQDRGSGKGREAGLQDGQARGRASHRGTKAGVGDTSHKKLTGPTERTLSAQGTDSSDFPLGSGGTGEFRVELAVDGSLVGIRPPANRRRKGGGRRGRVLDYRDPARKRLLNKLNALPHQRLKRTQILFVTLTYAEVWPTDPKVWRRHRKKLKQSVEAEWPEWYTVRKTEPQKRGAPHHHLLVIVPENAKCRIPEFRDWLNATWFRITQSSRDSLPGGGVHVKVARHSWLRLAKYVAKKCKPFTDPETGELLAVGRYWDIWNEDQFPAVTVKVSVPLEVGERFTKLIYAHLGWCAPKWLESRNVFVPYQVARSLLDRAGDLAYSTPVEDVTIPQTLYREMSIFLHRCAPRRPENTDVSVLHLVSWLRQCRVKGVMSSGTSPGAEERMGIRLLPLDSCEQERKPRRYHPLPPGAGCWTWCVRAFRLEGAGVLAGGVRTDRDQSGQSIRGPPSRPSMRNAGSAKLMPAPRQDGGASCPDHPALPNNDTSLQREGTTR